MRQLPVVVFFTFVLLLAGLVPTISAAEDAAASFQEGVEYTKLDGPKVLYDPQKKGIEVLSFFWYNCGACYGVDQALTDWAASQGEDINFVRLPFVYRGPTNLHARIFFTLEAMGLGHDGDLKIFNLFQDQHHPINQPEQLPELVEALNLNHAEFIKTYESQEVADKMKLLDKLMVAYDLPGVPSMVINGKYKFDIGTAHGREGYLSLADRLIEQERKGR